MTLDHDNISIYQFQKSGSPDASPYLITNVQSQEVQLLDSLGIRNSSVFISNCTIWVEGITDRLYLNKFMEVLQKDDLKESYGTKRLKEDLHFSYIEYGGANIIHYSFDNSENWERIKAAKISQKILLIVDKDGTSEDSEDTKSRRLKELREHLGENLVVLPCREIENTLSSKVIKSTLQDFEGENQISFDPDNDYDYHDQYFISRHARKA
jgi:predicted ATP-dependent endonuclease of OLD family